VYTQCCSAVLLSCGYVRHSQGCSKAVENILYNVLIFVSWENLSIFQFCKLKGGVALDCTVCNSWRVWISFIHTFQGSVNGIIELYIVVLYIVFVLMLFCIAGLM